MYKIDILPVKKNTSASKYLKPKDRIKLENRTISKYDTKIIQPDGRIRYERDFGRKIGTNGETKMRVIVDEKKNKIVTSFPEI